MAGDSTSFFLDTAYAFARLNARDQWHAAATAWEARVVATGTSLVTTEFVLAEIGDALAKVQFRGHALSVIDILRSDPLATIVPASAELFAAGLDLYRRRIDKAWGLTDCCSFVVMQERGLMAALTTDEHFRQAGFRALLLEDP